MTRPPLRVIDPHREGRDAFLPCWCKERTGKPLPECRDCGGGGVMLARFPVPRKEA